MYDWLFKGTYDVFVSAEGFSLPVSSVDNGLKYSDMCDWPIGKVFGELHPRVKLRKKFLNSKLMQITKLGDVIMTDEAFERFIKQCQRSPGCGAKSLNSLRLALEDIKRKNA